MYFWGAFGIEEKQRKSGGIALVWNGGMSLYVSEERKALLHKTEEIKHLV
jgi:hypothetical protein